MTPLLLAEACNPDWVSIPLEGWSLARAIQDLTGGHLVTQIRNREALLRAGLTEGRDFTAIDSEAVAAKTYKWAQFLGGKSGKAWTVNTALSSLSYRHFEKLLWEQFGDRIKRHEFDLVHRITPVSPTISSRLATWCRKAGVPMVIGPINGGLPWPPGFAATLGQEREWLSHVRGVHRMMPGYRSTRRDAAAILCGSKYTLSEQPPEFADKCSYVPENAVDPKRFCIRRTRAAQRPIRAVFVGRLVPYKGPDMLLEAAMPLVKSGDLTIDLIGDGPMKAELEQLISANGLAGGVKMCGWVNHAELPARLAEMDLLTFPSIREFGGAVVLEAMAAGVVPIVVDYGGPGELATAETGFLIPLGSRQQIVAELRRILSEIASDPAMIDQRSPLARRRVEEHFTWPVKAKQILQIYQYVCRS
jgi:glycosyltransferase involved in cell wall biosynthesis